MTSLKMLMKELMVMEEKVTLHDKNLVVERVMKRIRAEMKGLMVNEKKATLMTKRLMVERVVNVLIVMLHRKATIVVGNWNIVTRGLSPMQGSCTQV